MFDAHVHGALLSEAPLLHEWLSSDDLNPQAVERGRQVQRFINAVRAKGDPVLPIQIVRREIEALTKEIAGEKNPERVRALGDVLEKLNDRYERLEKELLDEDDVG